MRVVFDTNVVVSALQSRRGVARLWMTSVLKAEHTLLISVPLMLEYEDVLSRPEQLKSTGLTFEQTARFLNGLCSIAEHVEIAFLWRPMLRDPDDEMVLETAVNGRADRLLTFNARDFAGADRLGIEVMQPGPAWTAMKRGTP
jgi:putative PIN family toxin of toxin-antitoxin system